MSPEGKQLCEWVKQAGGLTEFTKLVKAMLEHEQKMETDLAIAALRNRSLGDEARIQMGRVSFIEELYRIAEHTK